MTDIFGRYYTENKFSSLLVSGFQVLNPKTLLELGVGEGSLIKAAQERWHDLKCIASDIDEDKLNNLKENSPNILLSKINGLSKDLNKKLNLSIADVDIAVCNPPYQFLHQKTKKHISLLKSINFINTSKLGYLTTDIIFFAQNLNLLKTHGELGIILPDTLLSGKKFENFRKDLITNTTILSITQLPPKVFKKTEALTHILVVRKNKSTQKNVPVRLSNLDGDIEAELSIDVSSLINRMDFNFYKYIVKLKQVKGPTLNEINAEIFRGKFSKKELEYKLGAKKFFHLNCFSQEFKRNGKVLTKFAQTGDILLARVGKRCIGNVAYVRNGKFEISDCIFVIRVQKVWQKIVYETLISSYGQEWLKAYAHGVCSQFISQNDLKTLKVII